MFKWLIFLLALSKSKISRFPSATKYNFLTYSPCLINTVPYGKKCLVRVGSKGVTNILEVSLKIVVSINA
jgi:hypothetical protein